MKFINEFLDEAKTIIDKIDRDQISNMVKIMLILEVS